VVLALVVSLSFAAKSKGGKKRRMEFCVQEEWGFRHADPAMRDAALDKAKSLGATCIRQMLYMHDLHPCRGSEALDSLNRYIHIANGAKARKMRMQFVITGVAASWGAPQLANVPCGRPPGLNPTTGELAIFINKYVPLFAKKQYGGVRRFSIWNEPNLGSFLCAGTGVTSGANIDASKCKGSSLKRQATLYRKLYQAAWSKIVDLKKAKKISKKVRIFIGELAGAHAGAKFMSMVLRKGKPLTAHAFALHPYQYCTDPAKKSFKFTTSCKRKMSGGIAWTRSYKKLLSSWAKNKMLRSPGSKTVNLFLTEFGYHKTGPFAIPEALRVKWYPKAMNVARAQGAGQMTIYQLWPSAAGAWDTGLLTPEGQPLPSFIALQQWARKNGYLKK